MHGPPPSYTLSSQLGWLPQTPQSGSTPLMSCLDGTDEFTAASMVVQMPVRQGLTPAVVIAPWIDRALAAGALVACLLGLVALAGRARRPESATEAGSVAGEEQAATAVGQDVQPADGVDPEAVRR